MIEAFNRVVMRENIRYRSMLRGRPIGLGNCVGPGRLRGRPAASVFSGPVAVAIRVRPGVLAYGRLSGRARTWV